MCWSTFIIKDSSFSETCNYTDPKYVETLNLGLKIGTCKGIDVHLGMVQAHSSHFANHILLKNLSGWRCLGYFILFLYFPG